MFTFYRNYWKTKVFYTIDIIYQSKKTCLKIKNSRDAHRCFFKLLNRKNRENIISLILKRWVFNWKRFDMDIELIIRLDPDDYGFEDDKSLLDIKL